MSTTETTYGKMERFDDGVCYVYGMTIEDGENVIDTNHPIDCGIVAEDPNEMLRIASEKLGLTDARYRHDGGVYDHNYWIVSAEGDE